MPQPPRDIYLPQTRYQQIKNAMPKFLPFISRTRHVLAKHYAGHPFRVFKATLKSFLFVHLFWEYGFTISETWGASMMPTFHVTSDWVIESRLYRRGKNIVVGDVISFDSVVEPGEKVIKRVIGLEGDYVLSNTPGESDVMIQVPQGHVWVVGDNLQYSRDSRHFGPVPKALIKGKIIAKILPWQERKWIVNGLQSVTS